MSNRRRSTGFLLNEYAVSITTPTDWVFVTPPDFDVKSIQMGWRGSNLNGTLRFQASNDQNRWVTLTSSGFSSNGSLIEDVSVYYKYMRVQASISSGTLTEITVSTGMKPW